MIFRRSLANAIAIAIAIASGYIILSLPLSIFHIFRSKAQNTRILLVFSDTAMLALLTAGASAAAAIVYLAHKGNAKAKLAGNLPTVQLLLRAVLWLFDWLLCRSCNACSVDSVIWSGPISLLTEYNKSTFCVFSSSQQNDSV